MQDAAEKSETGMSGTSGRLSNAANRAGYSRSQGPTLYVGPPPCFERCASVHILMDRRDTTQQLTSRVRIVLIASVVSEMLRFHFGRFHCIAFRYPGRCGLLFNI